jgi:DNA-directed RNA polymerase specialized sigma24 family protein
MIIELADIKQEADILLWKYPEMSKSRAMKIARNKLYAQAYKQASSWDIKKSVDHINYMTEFTDCLLDVQFLRNLISEKEYQYLLLKYGYGHTYKEISTLNGRDRLKVKNIIENAKKKVKELYDY